MYAIIFYIMATMRKAGKSANKKMVGKTTGIVVPLGAIKTDESLVIGEFPALEKLIQFCKKSGLGALQLLPVNDTAMQSSPYSSVSAFALHPIYISLKALPEWAEAVSKDSSIQVEYDSFVEQHKNDERYNYEAVLNWKTVLLHKIYNAAGKACNIDTFCKKNPWVKSYAVYKNLKEKYLQASWKEWKKEEQILSKDDIQKRWKDASLLDNHSFYVWLQIRASEQFSSVAKLAKKEKIILKGDIPIMMNEDSVDTWEEKTLFDMKNRAGSPPDYENPNGQSWGFPIYDWKSMEAQDYGWWKIRIEQAAKYYSAFRIDHVLGFFRIWAIPEGEYTGKLGHEEPSKTIKRSELEKLGFDEGRLNWLSEPHIRSEWAKDRKSLEAVCDKLGNEELWNFKKSIKVQDDIRKALDSVSACDDDKNMLLSKWTDRALIKTGKNDFIPSWQHTETTAWQSLNDGERNALSSLFRELHEKNEKLWKKQGDTLLSVLTSASDMTACAEDLGVSLSCVPPVLDKLGILGLRVVRWCRKWNEDGQPFVPFADYDELSVSTTSVHDSSTLRQWWNGETDSVRAFIKAFKTNDDVYRDIKAENYFGEKEAEFVLSNAAKCNSALFIPPLQDFLYLSSKYYEIDENKERINIPGTVTAFNWTYRVNATMEELLADSALINKIKAIASVHKS